jgi:hypothetical protein
MNDPGFDPIDVVLDTPPLTGTLERVEIECAAALLVQALKVLGLGWTPIGVRQLAETIKSEMDAGNKPIATWSRNPFLRPDFAGLVARGFAVKSGPQGDEMLELTNECLLRLLPWVGWNKGDNGDHG